MKKLELGFNLGITQEVGITQEGIEVLEKIIFSGSVQSNLKISKPQEDSMPRIKCNSSLGMLTLSEKNKSYYRDGDIKIEEKVASLKNTPKPRQKILQKVKP